MKYFIGLTFSPEHWQFKKIDSFRKRFDLKYSRSSTLQMSLVPPFYFSSQDFLPIDCVELVSDIVHDHLYGISLSELLFEGMCCAEGKESTVFLRPQLPTELTYLIEDLLFNLDNSGAVFSDNKIKKTDKRRRTLLPLGRGLNSGQLVQAIDGINSEFSFPFSLPSSGVSLFRKDPGHWGLERKLFSLQQEQIEDQRQLFWQSI